MSAHDDAIPLASILGDGGRTRRRYLAVLAVENDEGARSAVVKDRSGPLPPTLAEVDAIEREVVDEAGGSAVLVNVIELADPPEPASPPRED